MRIFYIRFGKLLTVSDGRLRDSQRFWMDIIPSRQPTTRKGIAWHSNLSNYTIVSPLRQSSVSVTNIPPSAADKMVQDGEKRCADLGSAKIQS
jgi:hypothetical protein